VGEDADWIGRCHQSPGLTVFSQALAAPQISTRGGSLETLQYTPLCCRRSGPPRTNRWHLATGERGELPKPPATIHRPPLTQSPRGMHACSRWMCPAETSVRVSRETLLELERLRAHFGTRSADETIRKLVKERRSRALSRMIGSGKGIVSPFSEVDRFTAHD
jgi:hypothetical protein